MRLSRLLFRISRSSMVSTRSASGLAALPQETAVASNPKRKAVSDSPTKSKHKKVRTAAELATTIPPDTATLVPNGTDTPPLVPAILSFDFEVAKKHLIDADARFEDVFAKMQCKPFEQLDQVHPFRWVVDVVSALRP
jgi:DNA-3-methyladenine glycosylase II